MSAVFVVDITNPGLRVVFSLRLLSNYHRTETEWQFVQYLNGECSGKINEA